MKIIDVITHKLDPQGFQWYRGASNLMWENKGNHGYTRVYDVIACIRDAVDALNKK